jgi:hypothetical protein
MRRRYPRKRDEDDAPMVIGFTKALPATRFADDLPIVEVAEVTPFSEEQ